MQSTSFDQSLSLCFAVVPTLCQAQDQYKVLGEHVQQTKIEHMKSQMVIFKNSLEEFAIKHRHVWATLFATELLMPNLLLK